MIYERRWNKTEPMKFNAQLKQELTRYEKSVATQISAATTPLRELDEKQEPPRVRIGPSEKVVGGNILWKPIDKAAAMLLAKSPWWAHAPHVPKPPTIETKQPKKARQHMKGGMVESSHSIPTDGRPVNGKYTADSGLTVTMVNGEAMFKMEDINAFIIEQISKLPRETRPLVQQAEDARRVIDELLHGIGGDMEKFEANSKIYLNDIRQTRFTVVAETAAMTKELRELRQFFMGNDHKEQITRLRDFVDLCKDMQQLVQSGFLERVVDAMLRLDNK